MANTYFRNQFLQQKEGTTCQLYMKVAFGATGDPTLSVAQGVTSITRNSAGKYTILLADSYNKFLAMTHAQIGASSGATAQAAPILSLVSQAVATAAAPTIVLQYRAIDNSTATDPGNGEIAYFSFTLGNSSV